MQLSRPHRPAAVVAALLLGGIAGACGDPASPSAKPELRLEIVSGDGQEAVTRRTSQVPIGSGAMPEPLRVRVTDAAGRPLADQIVNWAATGGSVSPTPARTDAQGIAAVHWSMFSPNGGWSEPGLLRVAVSVHGGHPREFWGYARRGLTVSGITFSPGTADVRAGAAPVTMLVRLSDDRSDGSIGSVRAWLRGPTMPEGAGTVFADLALTGRIPDAVATGNGGYGWQYDMQEWSGTLTLPPGAEPGDWTLDRLEIAWGPGEADRGEVAGAALATQGVGAVLPVIGGAPGS